MHKHFRHLFGRGGAGPGGSVGGRLAAPAPTVHTGTNVKYACGPVHEANVKMTECLWKSIAS